MATELLFYSNKCIGCSSCAEVCPRKAHHPDAIHTLDRENCILCGACARECPTGARELCGTEMSVDEILSIAEKDLAFYGTLGGITISGGEPFAQKERTIALLKACKERGLSTAVETCGYADPEVLCRAVPFTDLFLFDIKDTDSLRHQHYTGVSNEKILHNLSLINEMHARIRLRCVMVRGVNTDETHYANLAKLAKSLKNPDGLELIPYHAYGGAKATFLGRSDNGRKEWIPKEDELERAKLFLRSYGVFPF